MDGYFLFFVIALITVLSPGPGVILTLSNAVRFGLSGTINGILGIALGTFVVASVSATSLGLLLATSAVAFSVIKFVGAAYLVYLGLKLWCSPRIAINERDIPKKSRKLQFSEGLLLQLTNPK
ncbi:MAG: LysE family translocator, partial [Sedimenticola sp.]|nr:LysE family translocator [Sedimenticola sp.]